MSRGGAHTSSATLDKPNASGLSKGSHFQSNSSRSLTQENLSNPVPCERETSGSQSASNGARWLDADYGRLLETVESVKGPTGNIDHKGLLVKWDTLRRDSAVSNVFRSANALIAKYKSLKLKGTKQDSSKETIIDAESSREGAHCLVIEKVSGRSTSDMGTASPPMGSESQGMNKEGIDAESAREGTHRSLEVDSASRHSNSVLVSEIHQSELECRNPAMDVENGGNPTGGEAAPTSDSSWSPESFDEEFKRNYNTTFLLKNRKPLKPLRNRRIPEEWLQQADDAILNCRKTYPDSFEHLNRAVYSAAKVINDRYFGQSAEANQAWRSKNNEMKIILCQNLGKLKSIVDRLKNHLPMTDHQRQNLKALRRPYGSKYKLKTIGQMEVLYHDLTAHLSKCQYLLKVKIDEAARKRVRWAPLNTLLREDNGTTSTPVESVRDYWEKIIGTPREFRMNPMLSGWERTVKEELAQKEANPDGLRRETDLENWEQVCKKARPFKACGPDNIHAFWWKILPSAKDGLFRIISNLRGHTTLDLPSWIARGRAVSLYKGSGDQNDPGNYRTIVCLNTCYKLITGMIARWIDCDVRTISAALPTNQMALQKGVWATTHAHILDRTIVRDVTSTRVRRQLSIAWIDFAKAFDSIPHTYIRWVLECIGVSKDIRDLLFGLMNLWEITFSGFVQGRAQVSTPLKVRNGVLQGDTLSPLLFCLSVAPISHHLNTTLRKYTTSTGSMNGLALSLNHLYYVDDLVIYTPEAVDLNRAVEDIELYASDIGCKPNSKKSAIFHLGPSETGDAPEADLSKLPTIRGRETYKYLGIEKGQFVDHTTMWDKIKDTVMRKTRIIFESQLTFRQKVSAFNSVAIPKAKYLYSNEIFGTGRFNSVVEEAKKLDQAIRTLLVELKVRHKAGSVARLYLDPKQGGLGLKTFRQAVFESVIYSFCYLSLRPELRTSVALMEKLDRRGKRTLISDFRETSQKNDVTMVITDPTHFAMLIGDRNFTDPTSAARAITHEAENGFQARQWDKFTELQTASSVYQNDELDHQRSHLWLIKGALSSEAANNAIAAQEGQLLVKGHPSRRNMDRTCRLHCQSGGAENAEHILTVCSHWRTTLMVKRHNSVARNIYYALCVKYGFETRHFNQKIEGHRTEGPIEIYWDHPVITRQKVLHHRPDIIVIDNLRRTVTIVEVSVSWHTRICKQEKRKYAKYAVNSTLPESTELNSDGTFPVGDNLATEMGRDLGYVVTVLPIVVGAIGEVSKNILGYLSKLSLPGSSDHLIERMSRSAVIGSCVIIKAHCSVPQGN